MYEQSEDEIPLQEFHQQNHPSFRYSPTDTINDIPSFHYDANMGGGPEDDYALHTFGVTKEVSKKYLPVGVPKKKMRQVEPGRSWVSGNWTPTPSLISKNTNANHRAQKGFNTIPQAAEVPMSYQQTVGDDTRQLIFPEGDSRRQGGLAQPCTTIGQLLPHFALIFPLAKLMTS